MRPIQEAHQSSGLDLVGGKGLHLQKLVGWKANVSPFFIFTTECFHYWQEHQGFFPQMSVRIEAFFQEHPVVAMRSSMIAEDREDASFAGLFETLLDVRLENWQEALMTVYRSVSSPRVKEYLERKKLKTELSMAVVVQAQVDVEKSGVLFTRSPVEPTAALAIDAGFGKGEGVVSGLTQVDHYQFTRRLELITQLSNNPNPVLTHQECLGILREGLRLEALQGRPSDIEWGILQGKVYIFQIRPITRSFRELTYFVDTNLSESYPGTVSPFTAGFVRKAYSNAFNESAQVLGAQGERLKRMSFHYARLISCVDDHLYYNLEHYYAALRALPGGEKNIEAWHAMIGGQVDSHEVPMHETGLSAVESFACGWYLLKLALRHKKTFASLDKEFASIYQEIFSQQERKMDPASSIRMMADLMERPLGFGLAALNDVFIMIGLKFMTKSLRQRGLAEDIVIDLLRTEEGVDSLKPLLALNELIRDVGREFLDEIGKYPFKRGLHPYAAAFRDLRARGREREVFALEKFLSLYGDRSFEELKLESLPLKNDPELLLKLMRWSSEHDTVQQRRSSSPDISLTYLQKKILHFTRAAIGARENTRLWRGKFYHLIRRFILQLDDEFKKTDPSWRSFDLMDFFSITHQEWVAFSRGDFKSQDIQSLMRARRGWQEKGRQYPEIIQWVESERLPSFELTQENEGLTGQGVSLGTAQGTALVLEHPNDALGSNLENFILVTKNTDPAWVYIMSRSRGLISEKGSLLSHTAIIGRELSIPTIVGVKGATQKIRTGDRLSLDASTGRIEIL